jgi:pimeloyl-ACP methyl ester carboxylesterase
MKNIYVISGLGAEERVFFKTNFGHNNVTHIKWLTPNKSETIEQYALRLTSLIKHESPILVGLSFGGMVAIEVAKHIKVEKIILISSAKTKNELPKYYRLAGKLNLQKLVPTYFFKTANVFTNWAFSSRTKSDKKILAAMIKETDVNFLKWAIAEILNWKNETIHNNVFHIHGTADRILPFKNTHNTIVVNGGPHLMVVTKAKEINKHLSELLA